MKYTFTYGRNSQLVWALTLPAFIGLIPLMVALELSNKLSPDSDWIFLTSMLLYLTGVIVFTLKSIFSIRADVEITIGKDKLDFSFPEKNVFHKNDFALPYRTISNTSEDNDKGFDFLYIETKNTSIKGFHLMAKEDDQNFILFKDLLKKAISGYYENISSEPELKHISIYQQWPMKWLAMLLLGFWFLYPAISWKFETNVFMTIKYWVIVAMSSPILLKVYLQNFGKSRA